LLTIIAVSWGDEMDKMISGKSNSALSPSIPGLSTIS
jgi:hypothetical protein